MKFKNTLILFLVLVVLGGYVYVVEVKQHEKKEKIEQQAKDIFSFKKDSVEVIDIRNSNGNFVIKKVQDEWQIVQPLQTDADESTINSMLGSLENAKKDKEFNIKPSQSAEFGLGSGAVNVLLTLRNGEQDSIRFGDKTPVGAYVFCDKIDTTVFTANESMKNSFTKNLFELRNKNMLRFKRADVKSIVLHSPHGKLQFDKSGVSDWNINSIDRPADNGKVSSVLSKLENNRVKTFVDEDGTNLRKYGLNRPAYQVDLVLGPEQGQKKLLIGKKHGANYYAKDEARKPVFEIDSSLVGELRKNVSTFRNTDFAKFDRNSVNHIVVQYADTLISCVKDSSGDWALDDTSAATVKKASITNFFSNLDFTKILDFVKDGQYKPAAYGFDKPALKVSLYKDHDLMFEATFGKQKGSDVYAANNMYKSVYTVASTKLKSLKLKLDDLVEKAPESKPDAAGSK